MLQNLVTPITVTLGGGATSGLIPHGLRLEGGPVAPDFVMPDKATAIAVVPGNTDENNIQFTNPGANAETVTFMVRRLHTAEQNNVPPFYWLGLGGNAGGGTSGDTQIMTRGASSPVAGDPVYVSAPDTADKADATSIATMPAIGFVESVISATQVKVRLSGVLGGLAGLTVDITYVIAVGGGIAKAGDASFPVAAGNILQNAGEAIDANTFDVQLDQDFITL